MTREVKRFKYVCCQREREINGKKLLDRKDSKGAMKERLCERKSHSAALANQRRTIDEDKIFRKRNYPKESEIIKPVFKKRHSCLGRGTL